MNTAEKMKALAMDANLTLSEQKEKESLEVQELAKKQVDKFLEMIDNEASKGYFQYTINIRRFFRIYDWHMIRFMLEQHGFRVSFINAGEEDYNFNENTSCIKINWS